MKRGKMNHLPDLMTIAKLKNILKDNHTAISTCISPERAAKKAVRLINQIVAPRCATHKIRCKWNNVAGFFIQVASLTCFV
jgi:hypothetical protein